MRAAILAVGLALTLVACGDPAPPAPAAPPSGVQDVQDVQDVEDIVNDLETVVRSAESESDPP